MLCCRVLGYDGNQRLHEADWWGPAPGHTCPAPATSQPAASNPGPGPHNPAPAPAVLRQMSPILSWIQVCCKIFAWRTGEEGEGNKKHQHFTAPFIFRSGGSELANYEQSIKEQTLLSIRYFFLNLKIDVWPVVLTIMWSSVKFSWSLLEERKAKTKDYVTLADLQWPLGNLYQP